MLSRRHVSALAVVVVATVALPIATAAMQAPYFGPAVSFLSSQQSMQTDRVELTGNVVVRIWSGNVLRADADQLVCSPLAGLSELDGNVRVAFLGGALTADKMQMRRVSVGGETYIEFTADRASLIQAQWVGPSAPSFIP